MKTKILILAAGPSVQWKHERSRHLLPIADEPLVLRTSRICSEFGYPATIVTDVPQVQEAVVRYFDPGPNKWIYDTIRNTQELWTDRTILLAGDTLFYESTIYEFLKYEDTCLWTGRCGVLALTYAPDVPRKQILKSLSLAWDEADRRGHGELQILMQLNLIPRTRNIKDQNLWDFDAVEKYQKCAEHLPWVASGQGAAYLAEPEPEAAAPGGAPGRL
jgi:hypothetical protein